MTDEEIDAMETGRTLDAAVDQYVFGRNVAFELGEPSGWEVVDGKKADAACWHPNDYVRLDYDKQRDGIQFWASEPHPRIVPHYSTSIAAAWQVVEKMREQGFTLELCSSACVGVSARFWPPRSHDALFGSADTDPLAICRAALKAVSRLPQNYHNDPEDSSGTGDLNRPVLPVTAGG